MPLADSYHEICDRIDNLKAAQGEESNPFSAPLIEATLVVGEENNAVPCRFNALNVSVVYAVIPDE